MRTSLLEIKLIEEQLLGRPSTPERLLFEARQLTDPSLRERAEAQQDVYLLINQYGRQQLKARLEAVHEELFTATKYAWWRRLFRWR